MSKSFKPEYYGILKLSPGAGESLCGCLLAFLAQTLKSQVFLGQLLSWLYLFAF